MQSNSSNKKVEVFYLSNSSTDKDGIVWLDGEKHYCPCNGRCHTESNPCSFDCISHHHLIEIKGKVSV